VSRSTDKLSLKMTAKSRVLLLITAVLAAYQIAVGIDGLGIYPVLVYTIGFGLILVVSLLMLIMGYDLLSQLWFLSLAALIPLSLSFGLVLQHVPVFSGVYLVFYLFGAVASSFYTYVPANKAMNRVMYFFHGIAAVIVAILPVVLVVQGHVKAGFLGVSLAGVLIIFGTAQLVRTKSGCVYPEKDTLLNVLPLLLLLMTAAIIGGFTAG
jgi:hypothetical protein